MKKVVLEILLSLICTLVIIFCFFIINKDNKSSTSGVVNIILIDSTNTVLINDTLDYEKGDTIKLVLERNYDIEMENGLLKRINECDTDITNYFLKIYINDEVANKGVEALSFKNNDTVKFVYTKVGDYNG